MKYARRGAAVALLGLVAVGMVGCPLDTFHVVSPYRNDSQNFTVNPADQLVMVVRFSEDVRFWTLKPGDSVILDTDLMLNTDITIAPGSAGNEIIITSDYPVDALLEFEPDGFFTLTIHGGNEAPGSIPEPPPVVGVGGWALDGDKDNVPGGTWVHHYTMLG